MLRLRTKRNAAEAERAVSQIADVQASIASLNDEDLLDLADIFAGDMRTFLGAAASAELKRRNLSLETHSSELTTPLT